jgi:hypothetical protein
MASELNAIIYKSGAAPETINIREAFEILLKRATAPPPPQPPVAETDEYRDLLARHDALLVEHNRLAEQYAEASEAAAAAKTAAAEAAAQAETQRLRADAAAADCRQAQDAIAELRALIDAQQLPENAFIVQTDPGRWQLLSETCERLRDAATKYPKLAVFGNITPAMLLLYMFERYLFERRLEWFFPLSIMPLQRIKEISSQYVE